MLKINVVARNIRTRDVTREERAANINAGCETRFQVEVLIYEQENWYPMTHAARFKDKAKAERCAARIQAAVNQSHKDWEAHVRAGGDMMKGPESAYREDGVRKFMGLDLRHWSWFYGITVPFVQLQPKPTAVEYNVD